MHRSRPLLPRLLLLAIAARRPRRGRRLRQQRRHASAPAGDHGRPAGRAQGHGRSGPLRQRDAASIGATAAAYCAGHKATAGELTGAIATLESLYQIDPSAQQPDGTTVEQAAVALERKLRACGARTPAKRLAKLAG